MADNQNTGVVTKKDMTAQTTSYNMAGIAPVESIFKMDADELAKAILTICKAYVDDIESVTFETTGSGKVHTIAWIPRNSKHLTDNTITRGDSLITRPVTRYSPEIKEFMNLFCPEKMKKGTFDADGGVALRGTVLDLDKFLTIIFDRDGSELAKVSGSNRRVRCELRCDWGFHRANGNPFHSVSYLTVHKWISSPFIRKQPRPVPGARLG